MVEPERPPIPAARQHVPRHSARKPPRRVARGRVVALVLGCVVLAGGAYLIWHPSSDDATHARSTGAALAGTSPSATSAELSVVGQLSVRNRHGFRAASTLTGSLCTGIGTYRDIHAGTHVVITDTRGTKLAVTALAPGYRSSDEACIFQFGAPVVPGLGHYRVQIGHRTARTEREAAMHALNLVLG